MKRLADGAAAVGLFNLGKATSQVAVTWAQAGASGPSASVICGDRRTWGCAMASSPRWCRHMAWSW